MQPFTVTHHQVTVAGTALHVAEAGERNAPAIVLLHGYPACWLAFEQVMGVLHSRFHLVAVDLPGIGGSAGNAPGDKKSIAACLDGLLQELGLADITLAGHDIGGMVAYAFLRYFPQRLSKAVILNTAVPGVKPWEAVKRNPHIWHFSFFALPSLPETLTAGRQKPLFDYFYNTLSANPDAIPEPSRHAHAAAYGDASALKAGFDWYRAFPQDENDNAGRVQTDVPLLYIRGKKEPGNIEEYVQGFRESGVQHVTGTVIPGSGHFSPEEQPGAVGAAIAAFIG